MFLNNLFYFANLHHLHFCKPIALWICISRICQCGMLSHWDSKVDLSDKFCGTSQFFSFAMWKLDEISIIHFSMTWTLQEKFCHGLHWPLSIKMVVVGRKKRNEMMRAFRFRKYHTRASALLKSSLESRRRLLYSPGRHAIEVFCTLSPT